MHKGHTPAGILSCSGWGTGMEEGLGRPGEDGGRGRTAEDTGLDAVALQSTGEGLSASLWSPTARGGGEGGGQGFF